ncbi:metal-dependent hydrolase [Tersicoccus solisilvae]|uniref:Metal-dependent hydrolase n=1 Tax=Tersicoccus solisilvae TaxID=1882339 RepID=A0ABQ1NPU7_9MICC|nr:endonuclease/exonuclease/phosphatase family protein [Tersicoccus solisilvae]GGC82347.1 metal-dependent hydrolase [Tersicoccus solisilvae]
MDDALIGPLGPPDLHVMTFNIRRRLSMTPRPADRWERRRRAVRVLLAAERPTLLGVQEAMADQADAVMGALGDAYGRVGHGRRADGRGEGCPLYYDADRIDLIAWEQTALSDTPQVPGSTSWGNMTPRVMVLAQLRDRATGVRFLAVNTHFDHLSPRSRIRSAEAVRKVVAEHGLPAVVTGDLNAGQRSSALRALLADGALDDAWRAAHVRVSPPWGTFANYRPPRAGRRRIDWIVTTSDVDVVRAGMNARRPDGVWPSDHLAVQAVVRLPQPEILDPSP